MQRTVTVKRGENCLVRAGGAAMTAGKGVRGEEGAPPQGHVVGTLLGAA
jgi:hypothetical protein